ncbi:MAG: hypothetical protein V8T46_13245 [Sutterella seckii]
MSARHSGHIAASGVIIVVTAPSARDGVITDRSTPRTGAGLVSIESIRASGGFPRRSSSGKASSAFGSPSKNSDALGVVEDLTAHRSAPRRCARRSGAPRPWTASTRATLLLAIIRSP